jgi:hypothetical protein
VARRMSVSGRVAASAVVVAIHRSQLRPYGVSADVRAVKDHRRGSPLERCRTGGAEPSAGSGLVRSLGEGTAALIALTP